LAPCKKGARQRAPRWVAARLASVSRGCNPSPLDKHAQRCCFASGGRKQGADNEAQGVVRRGRAGMGRRGARRSTGDHRRISREQPRGETARRASSNRSQSIASAGATARRCRSRSSARWAEANSSCSAGVPGAIQPRDRSREASPRASTKAVSARRRSSASPRTTRANASRKSRSRSGASAGSSTSRPTSASSATPTAASSIRSPSPSARKWNGAAAIVRSVPPRM